MRDMDDVIDSPNNLRISEAAMTERGDYPQDIVSTMRAS